jgi:DNA gyrase subunit A
VICLAIEYTDGKIVPVPLEEEMQKSYLYYAMYVNVDRAVPDVRDGLKPVQRRILYGMYELGLRPNRPFRKSAASVGDVMGKYHPHGDSAIYDTMARMVQDFSMRYPLIEGHGNWGSVDGDPPAAMRYTESRLSSISMELLRDIDKETVNFIPTYDEKGQQPEVLPSRFPNLLVNGALGIGVAMATNIPPHNLGEIIDALVYLIDKPDATLEEIMKIVQGPDFPTGGLILGKNGIKDAYATGRGRIIMRAKTTIEPMSSGRHRIVVTEIPYMVNKRTLVERIADLHNQKRVNGISALRDESDRQGMRIVIEVRKDANPNVVLNQLFKHSQMQATFGAIMLALVDGEPKVLSLLQMLKHYLDFQQEVLIRLTKFDLNAALDRAHILEGLRIALDNIDAIIALIKSAKNDKEAKEKLMENFGLSERQAVHVLDMQLRRLTSLEREKIDEEYRQVLVNITRLRGILEDESKQMSIIKEDLLDVSKRFADPRRTQIVPDEGEIDIEDLIAEEDIVITLTHSGYIKRLPVNAYKAQKRGGRGITAMNTKDEDFVQQLFISSTHSYMLFFTNKGKVYRLRGHEIPEASRTARGTNLINLVPLDKGERVQAAIPITSYSEDYYLIMATKNGLIKKTKLTEYDSSRSGLIGISLNEDDELVSVLLSDGNQNVIMVTANGQAIRFSETEVRAMGRQTKGVIGIRLNKDDYVVAVDSAREEDDLLVISSNGYGKRTPLSEYRLIGRGGKGVRTLNVNFKTGQIVGAKVVREEDELMVISAQGVMIRMSVSGVTKQGRSTQGVRMMRIQEGDTVKDVAQLISKEDEEDEEENSKG